MIEQKYTESKIEAMILASTEPLAAKRIAQVMEDITPSLIAKAITSLNENYSESGSSFRIREIAGGYQFYILSEYVGLVEELFSRQRKLRLSRAALETVAITAYRQPVTKTEIEYIRGVASDGVLRTLLEKNLVTITGRAETVGKPLQYGITNDFLKFFGLAKIDDLPSMTEIEKMITTTEPRSQTELSLKSDDNDQPVKLNIADGTFDPIHRSDNSEDTEEASNNITTSTVEEDNLPVTEEAITNNKISDTNHSLNNPEKGEA